MERKHLPRIQALTDATVDALNYIAERHTSFPRFPMAWNPSVLAGSKKVNGTRKAIKRHMLEAKALLLQQACSKAHLEESDVCGEDGREQATAAVRGREVRARLMRMLMVVPLGWWR